MISEELSEGNSFFIFLDKNPYSLSSCCFDGSQMTLTKNSINKINFTTFENLYNVEHDNTIGIFHDGGWSEGNVVRLKADKQMYEISMSNKKKNDSIRRPYSPNVNYR